MLPFGVTIPATVPQQSEIPEVLMNYPLCIFIDHRVMYPVIVVSFFMYLEYFWGADIREIIKYQIS